MLCSELFVSVKSTVVNCNESKRNARSYADCGVLFTIPIEKLLKGEYYGRLTEEDQRNLFDVLETTETLSTKQKKRFGIKRR